MLYQQSSTFQEVALLKYQRSGSRGHLVMPEKYIRVATGQPHDLQTW